MSLTDTKSTSTQDRPIGRERIACLKRIVSQRLLEQVIDQNSDFLGRAKANRCFEKMEVLSDGSYLSKIYESDYDRLHDRNGTVVRVIEYTIDDPERVGNGEVHRLLPPFSMRRSIQRRC